MWIGKQMQLQVAGVRISNVCLKHLVTCLRQYSPYCSWLVAGLAAGLLDPPQES